MKAPAPGDHVTESVVLIEELAAGGMGQVWIAHHLALKTEVAVKFLWPQRDLNETEQARFLREASAAARVKSPHVVTVFDSGVSPTIGPYIVMELLEGEDLDTRLRRGGPLAIAEAIAVFKQVGHALAQAHEAGLVHRDLKPANIFLLRNSVDAIFAKVLDFGIAKDLVEPLTNGAPVSIGTPSYMSPEQMFTGEVTPASDLYALGLMAFRVLTGTYAIGRAARESLGIAAYRLAMPKASNLRPDVPVAFDSWLKKACAFSIHDRFENVDAQTEAFVRVFDETPAKIAASSDAYPPHESTTKSEDLPAEQRPFVLARAHHDIDPPRPDVTNGDDHALNSEPWTPGTTPPHRAARAIAEAPSPSAVTRSDPQKRARLRNGAIATTAVCALIAFAIWGIHALRVSFASNSSATAAASPSGATLATSNAPGANGLAAATTQPPIRLPMIASVHGADHLRGEAMLAAARAGAAAVNEHGGIDGRTLAIVPIDDEGDTGAFLQAKVVDAQTNSDVNLVLGPTLTSQMALTAPLLGASGRLTLSASASSIGLAEFTPNLVQLAPSDAGLGVALAALMTQRSCTSTVVIASDDRYGIPLAQALETRLRHAITIRVAAEAQRDYSAIVEKVKLVSPACVALLVPPRVAVRYLLLATKRTPAIRNFSGDTLASSDFIELSFGDRTAQPPPKTSLADGLRGVRSRPSPHRPEHDYFVKMYRRSANSEPIEPFLAEQFDAVVLAAIALHKVGITATAPALKEALFTSTRGNVPYGAQELDELFRAQRRGIEIDYEAASGDMTFDGAQRRGSFGSWTIINGKVVDDLQP